jgi:fibronectin type 3 domain-containing protein
MKKAYLITGLILIVSLAAATAAGAKEEQGMFLTASSGKGDIFLLWYVPVENRPAKGWRLSDAKGKVIVDQILPLAPASKAGLTKDQIDSVQDFLDSAAQAKSAGRENRKLFNGIFILNVLSSFEKAKALGLAWKLSGVAPGPAKYIITGLDKNKRPKGIRLVSQRIDAAKATPLPPEPEGLKIVPDMEGAKLFWKPVPDSRVHPVLAYEIERRAKDKALSERFKVIKGVSWEPELPAHTDTSVPVEQEITYRIYSMDCFGRKSLPASAAMFIPDMMTLKPPRKLSSKAGAKQITLSWETPEQVRPAGFVVERACGSKGLYQVLTPEGLRSKTRKYTDNDVIRGVYYHYRVRAVGTDGTLGAPSSPVMARTDSTKSPPPPKKVTAKVNPVLVTLSWEKPDYPVAGYIVERRSKATDQWARRNADLLKPRIYKDRLKPGTYGVLYYRVSAAGFDGRRSKPCRPVKVELKDRSAPARPVITSIDGRNGKVVLTFEPDKKDKKTKTFTILRDLPSRKQGKMIQTGIAAKQRQFVDTDVIPGQGYWYAVVALDAQGRESHWSERHLVKVMAPAVPKPGKPSLKVVKKPFAHIRISFKQPPDKISVSLQRKESKDLPWTTLSKGLTGTDEAVDTNPVKSGTCWYRIVYHSINGPEGEPSDAVEINL